MKQLSQNPTPEALRRNSVHRFLHTGIRSVCKKASFTHRCVKSEAVVQIFLHTDPLTHWGCMANFLSECVNFVLITHNFFTHWLLHTRAANSLT
jgi:hypothetical protein